MSAELDVVRDFDAGRDASELVGAELGRVVGRPR
jgi:hypothetical protein